MILEFYLSKKTVQQNLEAKVYTDATLTSELITPEIDPERKPLKPLKVSKPLWNLTCQKK